MLLKVLANLTLPNGNVSIVWVLEPFLYLCIYHPLIHRVFLLCCAVFVNAFFANNFIKKCLQD